MHMSVGAFEGQKREPYTLEIKLQAVWAMKWVLESELRSSAQEQNVLSCWAISLALREVLKDITVLVCDVVWESWGGGGVKG